jgi:hypothetical protein
VSTTTIGREQMELGLARAGSTHYEALQVAQLVAQFLGGTQETVTVDDVFAWVDPKALGKAAGAIFRNGPWDFVGWQESTRESNHGRPIRSWRLK